MLSAGAANRMAVFRCRLRLFFACWYWATPPRQRDVLRSGLLHLPNLGFPQCVPSADWLQRWPNTGLPAVALRDSGTRLARRRLADLVACMVSDPKLTAQLSVMPAALAGSRAAQLVLPPIATQGDLDSSVAWWSDSRSACICYPRENGELLWRGDHVLYRPSSAPRSAATVSGRVDRFARINGSVSVHIRPLMDGFEVEWVPLQNVYIVFQSISAGAARAADGGARVDIGRAAPAAGADDAAFLDWRRDVCLQRNLPCISVPLVMASDEVRARARASR
jgi:hypothetical protein